MRKIYCFKFEVKYPILFRVLSGYRVECQLCGLFSFAWSDYTEAMITIDDFKKLEIKIGKAMSAERIPNSDKLIKIIFDIGDEQTRQIVAGIALAYPDPTVLIGKEMPIVLNLEPRTLRGETSYGMILAASNDGVPVVLYPEKEVPPGSVVR